MKKIAIASAAMGGAALIAFGASGTFASFTDEAVTTGSAGAGTLVLGAEDSITIDEEDLLLAPGESTTLAFPVQNRGSVDGTLTSVGAITRSVDECTSATEEEDDEDCDGGAGDFADLADVATYQVYVDAPEDCNDDIVLGRAPNITDGWKMAQLNGASVTGTALGAGEVTCFVIRVALPESAGDLVQGDSATLTIDLTLEQDLPAV